MAEIVLWTGGRRIDFPQFIPHNARPQGENAAAAKKGAPQAQPIADKFHLLKNLRDGLKELMARKQKVLPEVEEDASDGIPLRAQGKRPASALSEVPKPDESEKQWRSMSKEPRLSPARSEPSS